MAAKKSKTLGLGREVNEYNPQILLEQAMIYIIEARDRLHHHGPSDTTLRHILIPYEAYLFTGLLTTIGHCILQSNKTISTIIMIMESPYENFHVIPQSLQTDLMMGDRFTIHPDMHQTLSTMKGVSVSDKEFVDHPGRYAHLSFMRILYPQLPMLMPIMICPDITDHTLTDYLVQLSLTDPSVGFIYSSHFHDGSLGDSRHDYDALVNRMSKLSAGSRLRFSAEEKKKLFDYTTIGLFARMAAAGGTPTIHDCFSAHSSEIGINDEQRRFSVLAA